ncbi:MAG: hypothetical protein IJ371_03060 [Clostridia bacterium]|nr:hypothetical protein [Clostridia bacterium]
MSDELWALRHRQNKDIFYCQYRTWEGVFDTIGSKYVAKTFKTKAQAENKAFDAYSNFIAVKLKGENL